jgi:hypothetical protein
MILSIQILFLAVTPVKAKEDDNKEVVILDDSNINVAYAKHFTLGDIDGDGISEIITFDSDVKDSGTHWTISTHYQKKNIWIPDLSIFVTEKVSGHIHNVDIGNFDKDKAHELIIASWQGHTSRIYLLDFIKSDKRFHVTEIIRLNSTISDLKVSPNKGTGLDTIYLLYNDNPDSAENFKTKIMMINRVKKDPYHSEIIFAEAKVYWNLFTIGQFIKNEPCKSQILLYQYKTTESTTREAIVKIIDQNGNVILNDKNIGDYTVIRDITTWRRKRSDSDELCMLDMKRIDGGYSSKIVFCTFNKKAYTKIEERFIESNNVVKQICIGKLEGKREKFFVLDPYYGSLTYIRCFDDEATDHYNLLGYATINTAFNNFESIYESDLDIYVSSSGDHHYTSTGSNSYELFYNFEDQVGHPNNYGADIAIAKIMDPISDPEVLGLAYCPGRYSAIFSGEESDIICHEVGHNYGLDHCSNSFCIMTASWHPFVWDFCDSCENQIDKDKFGSPPSSGCPILYTFNGTEYVQEGLLDIHDTEGKDKTNIHMLSIIPYPVKNKIHLRLSEHPKTISYIDHVRLYGRLKDGHWIGLHLDYAIHSSKGEITNRLKHSDDLRVEQLGAEYNNGISENINLKFKIRKSIEITEFIFVIEGNNEIIK